MLGVLGSPLATASAVTWLKKLSTLGVPGISSEILGQRLAVRRQMGLVRLERRQLGLEMGLLGLELRLLGVKGSRACPLRARSTPRRR